MRLSIRLQNKGKKNHPYWHIVVAPQHKNIFGRYVEHIGYWSPRHNVNIKRQVVFNIPKLMYWLSNGAIPTFKVQKFMSMFGLFPKPWYYIKSAAQLAELKSKQKPEQQLTPKQKSLKQRKRKRQERQQLAPKQFHRYQAYALRVNKIQQQLLAKQHANQFQNQVIRQALHQSDFQKYDRLAQLSGNSDNSESKPTLIKLKQTKQKLRKYKSQLAFLERQHTSSHYLQKSKLALQINNLITKLNQIQNQQSNLALPQNITNTQQFISQQYLQKKLKYQLITKKLQKTQQQLQNVDKLFQPITIGQLAQTLIQVSKQDPNLFDGQKSQKQMYLVAQQLFTSRNQSYAPMTRLDLLMMKDKQYQDLLDDQQNQVDHNIATYKKIIEFTLQDGMNVPSIRPVHPRPDLKTYIPQQHYDPIDQTKLDIMMMDSLQPHQELEKYRRKRNISQTNQQRKNKDHRKRMERLRLVTQN